MTSEQKIKEAEFFLDKINENYADHQKCEFCVSAFLSAGFSLFDHTLQEYNYEFDLRIPRRELNIKSIYDKANAADDQKVMGFIRLFASEYLKIVRNPLSASLLTLRNINTHESTNLTAAGTFVGEGQKAEKLYFLSELEDYLPTLKDELIGWVNSKNYLVTMKNELQLEADFLTDNDLNAFYQAAVKLLTQNQVKVVCEKYQSLLKAFVSAIRAKYPRF